jgi:HAD superfamily phosphatase
MVSALKNSGQTTNLPAARGPTALTTPEAPARSPARCLLLFDLDGVIRDVAGSYRRALQSTVEHYSGWRPEPSVIDALKGEGLWNNDWDASLELLRRHAATPLPEREALIDVFSGFYFGDQATSASGAASPEAWNGYIKDEPLLVDASFFAELSDLAVGWGFVSGAEPPSARFLLETRLGLTSPPLIAMGDAPDKPDPTGLLQLASSLIERPLGKNTPPIAYLGDTVADVQTVVEARRRCSDQRFFSLAVAPPHLQAVGQERARHHYEARLSEAGADVVLSHTAAALEWCRDLPLNVPSQPCS